MPGRIWVLKGTRTLSTLFAGEEVQGESENLVLIKTPNPTTDYLQVEPGGELQNVRILDKYSYDMFGGAERKIGLYMNKGDVTINPKFAAGDAVYVDLGVGGKTTYFRIGTFAKEIPSRTNTCNLVGIAILSKPAADPVLPGEAAWCAFTSEIEAPAIASKFYVGAYFGAIAPSGSGAFIWGLNALATLEAGSIGNAIGTEIDLNNYQKDDVGEGLAISCGGTFNPYAAIHVATPLSNKWNRGILLENCKYGLVMLTVSDIACWIPMPTGFSGQFFKAQVNALDRFTILNTGGLVCRNPNTPFAAFEVYIANDTQPKVHLWDGGIAFGPGGSTQVDTIIYRSGIAQLICEATFSNMLNSQDLLSFGTLVKNDTNYRWYVTAGGLQAWGNGTVIDTVLYRSGTDLLATDDNFKIGINLFVLGGLAELDGGVMINLIPDSDNVRSLGAANKRWYKLYGVYVAADENFMCQGYNGLTTQIDVSTPSGTKTLSFFGGILTAVI